MTLIQNINSRAINFMLHSNKLTLYQ